MKKFRVIEGTIWEIQAETLEEAQQIYEKYFNEGDDELRMQEIEASSHWFGEVK